MADDKYGTKAEAKADAKDDAPKAKGGLGSAGESSDPAVQDALARLEIARANRATLEADDDEVKAADDEVAKAEKALADLGYQA